MHMRGAQRCTRPGGNRSPGACRDGDGAAAAPQHTDDADVAFEAQREEYRANLRTMLQMLGNMAEEQLEASAADVDGMSYEELQALGETIGKVTVRPRLPVVSREGACLYMAQRPCAAGNCVAWRRAGNCARDGDSNWRARAGMRLHRHARVLKGVLCRWA